MKPFKTRIAALVIALGGALGATGSVQAALINSPVPTNSFISVGGLDWAWAFPLPSTDPRFDLSFQSAFGWGIPTNAELAVAPLATAFIFPGANVPLGGVDPVSGAHFQAVLASLTGDAACATPYFSTLFLHCDWQDGLGQLFGPWAGLPGGRSQGSKSSWWYAGL